MFILKLPLKYVIRFHFFAFITKYFNFLLNSYFLIQFLPLYDLPTNRTVQFFFIFFHVFSFVFSKTHLLFVYQLYSNLWLDPCNFQHSCDIAVLLHLTWYYFAVVVFSPMPDHKQPLMCSLTLQSGIFRMWHKGIVHYPIFENGFFYSG